MLPSVQCKTLGLKINFVWWYITDRWLKYSSNILPFILHYSAITNRCVTITKITCRKIYCWVGFSLTSECMLANPISINVPNRNWQTSAKMRVWRIWHCRHKIAVAKVKIAILNCYIIPFSTVPVRSHRPPGPKCAGECCPSAHGE